MTVFFKLISIIYYLIQKMIKKLIPTRNLKDKKEEPKRNNHPLIEHYELVDQLKANVGKHVTMKTQNLTHLYQNQINDRNFELRAQIIEVDDEWIKLELSSNRYLNVRTHDLLYFRVDLIIDFYVNEESERVDTNV